MVVPMIGPWRGVGLVCLLWMSLAGPVRAHGLGAEARLLDGKVVIQVYFDDDTPSQGAKVSARDLEGRSVWEGRTDLEGKAIFAAPSPGLYRVAIDAGAGHRTGIRFTIPDQAGETGSLDRSPGDGQIVSEGKTREEFTRLPLFRLAVGLAVIALAFLALPRLVKILTNGKGSTSSPT